MCSINNINKKKGLSKNYMGLCLKEGNFWDVSHKLSCTGAVDS